MATVILNDASMELQENISNISQNPENLVSVGEVRTAYAERLLQEPFFDNERSNVVVHSDPSKPIFRDYHFHPDEQPKAVEMTELVTDLAVEASSLDAAVMRAANNYARLISDTIERLNSVKQRLAISRQRIQDMNFLSSSYKGITISVPMTADNMSGSFCFTQNTFSAFASSYTEAPLTVVSVTGNGYSGNKHVFDKDGSFLSDTDYRGNTSAMTDKSPLTSYEYSRICGQPFSDADVNADHLDAACIITLYAGGSEVNAILLESEYDGIRVTDVSTSADGKTYSSGFSGTTIITDGICVLSFPSAKYIRLSLSSSVSVPGEKLGSSITDISGTRIMEIRNAVRKVIQITSIQAYRASYRTSEALSPNLAPENGCTSIAVIANEYMQADSENGASELITYELIVNGESYAVQPINSDRSGIKLITASTDIYDRQGTLFLEEPIRTAQLRMKISPSYGLTPFVGGLRVCIG